MADVVSRENGMLLKKGKRKRMEQIYFREKFKTHFENTVRKKGDIEPKRTPDTWRIMNEPRERERERSMHKHTLK